MKEMRYEGIKGEDTDKTSIKHRPRPGDNGKANLSERCLITCEYSGLSSLLAPKGRQLYSQARCLIGVTNSLQQGPCRGRG